MGAGVHWRWWGSGLAGRGTMERGMAIILQFRRPDDAAAQAAKPAGLGHGEIIIFPGVRIERRASGGTPGGAGASPRKRAQRSRKK